MDLKNRMSLDQLNLVTTVIGIFILFYFSVYLNQ